MVIARNRTPRIAAPERITEARLPDGRRIAADDEISVRGASGRFRIRWINDDGSVTCWSLGKQMMRTFHADRVKTVHRKRTPDRKR